MCIGWVCLFGLACLGCSTITIRLVVFDRLLSQLARLKLLLRGVVWTSVLHTLKCVLCFIS